MTRILSGVMFLFGVALLVVNVVGLSRYTSIREGDPRVLDDSPRTVSERLFWESAYRREGEETEAYVRRLSALISGRMLLIDPRYARPTFFENYLLWLYARHLGRYEWTDTRRAVRLGGGFCSQHAIVLNNILREQGIPSRILGLGGHVVNEVLIDGAWKVYDSDYRVALGQSLRSLEVDPESAYRAYRGAGRPEGEARRLAEAFATEEDNWHFSSSRAYAIRDSSIEWLSLSLVWVIPVALILLGGAIWKFGRARR